MCVYGDPQKISRTSKPVPSQYFKHYPAFGGGKHCLVPLVKLQTINLTIIYIPPSISNSKPSTALSSDSAEQRPLNADLSPSRALRLSPLKWRDPPAPSQTEKRFRMTPRFALNGKKWPAEKWVLSFILLRSPLKGQCKMLGFITDSF